MSGSDDLPRVQRRRNTTTSPTARARRPTNYRCMSAACHAPPSRSASLAARRSCRHHADDSTPTTRSSSHHPDRRRCDRGVLDPVRAAGLPAHHDVRRRRRPARLVHPRQQRQRADQRQIRDDHGLGRRPCLVQARRAGRIPRDLKRLADGSLAWFQTFGPGFGNDPDQRLRELPARRHADRSDPDRRRGDQPP